MFGLGSTINASKLDLQQFIVKKLNKPNVSHLTLEKLRRVCDRLIDVKNAPELGTNGFEKILTLQKFVAKKPMTGLYQVEGKLETFERDVWNSKLEDCIKEQYQTKITESRNKVKQEINFCKNELTKNESGTLDHNLFFHLLYGAKIGEAVPTPSMGGSKKTKDVPKLREHDAPPSY